MSIIVDQEGYQYASLVAATIFLLPQIQLGLKTSSLKDVSTSSMVLIVFGSTLWAFYMYENNLMIYAALTTFVGTNALCIIILQMYYYYSRVNEHMQTLDQPPSSQSVNINIPQHDNSV